MYGFCEALPIPFCEGPHTGLPWQTYVAGFFFQLGISFASILFWKRIRWHDLWFTQILATVIARKSRQFFLPKNFFFTHFWPKTLIKHIRKRDKPIYGLIKQKKNILKNKINLKQKINLSCDLFYHEL
jgi:hypothetical protein